jgi:hypothetical protein
MDTAIVPQEDTSAAVSSHLRQMKDRLCIRMFETSSPLLEKVTRFERMAYDLSYTEFRADTGGDASGTQDGRTFVGWTSLSPTGSVNIIGSGTYRKNPSSSTIAKQWEPRLELWTSDLPKGIDFNAQYRLKFGRPSGVDSSSLESSRSVEVWLRPGTWLPPVGWITLRTYFERSPCAGFSTTHPALVDIIKGDESLISDLEIQSLRVILNPWSSLVFQSDNTWTQSTENGNSFATVGDLKTWVGNRGLWETRATLTMGERDAMSVVGTTRFEKGWSRWLTTAQGVNGDYATDTSGVRAGVGPELWVSLRADDWLFLRQLTNNHTLAAAWPLEDGQWRTTPTISYSFILKAIIRPNITGLVVVGFKPMDTPSSIISVAAKFGAVF